MATDQIWSDDGDLYLREPGIFNALPAGEEVLVSGTDGATDATGKVVTSATVAAGFTVAGVGKDSEDVDCTHFLEILSGGYQGLYRIASVSAGGDELNLDRPIAASQSSLPFQVRTFNRWHAEAHLHYQDYIKRIESDEDWDDSELHARSKRDLRDLCVARVLAIICGGASRAKEDLWDEKARKYLAMEQRALQSMPPLEKDTDGDGESDEDTTRKPGSLRARIV